MEQLTDLKAILHSHRANIYYLEYCRVLQKDGRIVYLSESKRLQIAKKFQIARIDFIIKIYTKEKELKLFGIDINELQNQFNKTKQDIQNAP